MTNKKEITISLTIDDAETLHGLLDGCRGTSEDEDFNEFADVIIKSLERKINNYYTKKKKDSL